MLPQLSTAPLGPATGAPARGEAGTDVAVAVAQRAAELDTRSASATAEEDRQMIHRLIEQMPGDPNSLVFGVVFLMGSKLCCVYVCVHLLNQS